MEQIRPIRRSDVRTAASFDPFARRKPGPSGPSQPRLWISICCFTIAIGALPQRPQSSWDTKDRNSACSTVMLSGILIGSTNDELRSGPPALIHHGPDRALMASWRIGANRSQFEARSGFGRLVDVGHEPHVSQPFFARRLGGTIVEDALRHVIDL